MCLVFSPVVVRIDDGSFQSREKKGAGNLFWPRYCRRLWDYSNPCHLTLDYCKSNKWPSLFFVTHLNFTWLLEKSFLSNPKSPRPRLFSPAPGLFPRDPAVPFVGVSGTEVSCRRACRRAAPFDSLSPRSWIFVFLFVPVSPPYHPLPQLPCFESWV